MPYLQPVELVEDFDFRGAAYRDLWSRTGARATAFQHPIWLGCLADHLLTARKAALRVACAWNGDRLGAVAAFTLRRKNGLQLLEAADLGVCDYTAPLVAADTDPAILATALPRFDLLRIRNIRLEHAAPWRAVTGAVPSSAGYSAHAVALAPPFPQWREANVRRGLASQNARKWKRWQRQGEPSFVSLSEPEAIRAAIHRLAGFRHRRFDGDPIQTAAVRDLFSKDSF